MVLNWLNIQICIQWVLFTNKYLHTSLYLHIQDLGAGHRSEEHGVVYIPLDEAPTVVSHQGEYEHIQSTTRDSWVTSSSLTSPQKTSQVDYLHEAMIQDLLL